MLFKKKKAPYKLDLIRQQLDEIHKEIYANEEKAKIIIMSFELEYCLKYMFDTPEEIKKLFGVDVIVSPRLKNLDYRIY